MSRENVEAMRSWVEAYNRRDMDALVELSAQDFEFRSIFVSVESVFRSPNGFPYDYFRTLDDAYEHFVVVPREFIDAGAAVMMLATAEWRGKASGAEGQTEIAVASWIRAGKVFRAETFTSREEAFEAVGLRE